MSFLRKTLRTIYPAHDELTIYSMALAIGFLALLHRQFAELLIHGWYLIFVIETADAFKTGWWEGAEYLFGMSMLLIVTVFGLIASIWLPFTRRRFDDAVVFIIISHSIMMCTANFIAAQRDGGVWNQVIAGGSLIWFFGYCICLRRQWIVEWVSRREASCREALVAGVSIFVAVGISSLVLHWHWASCYAFSFVTAVTIAQVLNRVIRVDEVQKQKASQFGRVSSRTDQ